MPKEAEKEWSRLERERERATKNKRKAKEEKHFTLFAEIVEIGVVQEEKGTSPD